MTSPTHFPIRLFRWFLSRQILLAMGLLLILNGSLLILTLMQSQLSDEAQDFAQRLLVYSALGSIVIMVLVSMFMVRRLVGPLGRLIQKTRRLRDYPFEAEEMGSVELAYDEPGEWFELERALNQLGQVLRQKTIRLSREKTELRTIMSAVSEAVLAIDQEQRVLFYNPQFTLMFDAQKNMSELKVSEVLRAPEVLAAYRECLSLGQPVRREVSVVHPSGGAPKYFELSVAPLKKKHNQEIYAAVGVFFDITELKQVERIRIEFVGNVSHELRTPLTTIHGYLQTVMQDFRKGRFEQSGEFLEIVSKNVVRLKNLVEDLLDLSSLESGQELKCEWVDTRILTETVLTQIQSRDHRIELSFSADQVFADGKRVEQVLRNLVENAVRYVPNGKDIRIEWKNSEGGVLLSVKDQGPGIAPEHQARLFERFYRVDESRARTDGGTGIGLSLVKHIMQRHGGQVTVKSQLGFGAEFLCQFPSPKNA